MGMNSQFRGKRKRKVKNSIEVQIRVKQVFTDFNWERSDSYENY